MCIAVFSVHYLQYCLRRLCTPSSTFMLRLAVFSRLLQAAVLLALFGSLEPEDWVHLFIRPKQQYMLPAWAISASMLCAYSLVHGLLTLHHPLPFRHVVWIHLLFLAAGWNTLGSLHLALQHPSLAGVGTSFCVTLQRAALTMLAWGTTPPVGPGMTSLSCQTAGEAYLLAFSLCGPGCLCPLYLCYRRERRIKADYMAAVVCDQHPTCHQAQQQRLPLFLGMYMHAVAVACLLLVSHTLCEVMLLWS
jgi:hypothetical protein